jgi:hypothetical protein
MRVPSATELEGIALFAALIAGFAFGVMTLWRSL